MFVAANSLFLASYHDLGENVAAFAVGAGFLALLAKGVQMMWKPKTHKLCAASLGCLISAFAIILIAGMLAKGSSGGPLVGLIGVITSVLLIPASLVCGIVGLISYDKSRYDHGRGLAIAGVTLSGFALVLGGTIFLVGASKSVDRIANAQKTAQVANQTPGPLVDIEQARCSLQLPNGWVQTSPADSVSSGILAFANRTHDFEMLFVFGPLKAAPSEALTIAEASLGITIGMLADSVKLEPGTSATIAGTEFLKVSGTCTSGPEAKQFANACYTTAANGFGYSLIGFAPPHRAEILGEQMRLAATGLSLIPDGATPLTTGVQ